MFLLARHHFAKKVVRQQWQQREANHLVFSRPTSELRVRFLVEHYARDSQLRTEPGVSYLVTTDSAGAEVWTPIAMQPLASPSPGRWSCGPASPARARSRPTSTS